MRFIPASLGLVCITALTGCGFSSDLAAPANSLYCDNFMIYDMCARDTNRDGTVEYVYFEDSNEIFLYREGTDRRLPRGLDMHRCALPMDDGIIATTSRMFYIDEETSYLERQDIRGALMIKYIAYMPRVTACNMRAEQETAISTDG